MRTLVGLLIALSLAAPVAAAGPQRAPGWIGIAFEVKSGDAFGGGSAVVTEVRSGSPAATAGIEVGDELLTINGVSTAGEFENLAERLALRVGDRVQIRLQREGRRVDLSLTAGQRPADFGMLVAEPSTADSMAESMFRAIDSLRIQILATRPQGSVPVAPRVRVASGRSVVPEPPEPVEAPFEFFIFRGEQHDSLEMEMEVLNDRIATLREQEQRLAERRRTRNSSRSEAQAVNAELAELRDQVARAVREAAALRAAMTEAARATAAVEYFAPPAAPDAPDAAFRPLTPYLLGSNRVAGAEVVDLKPGLAEYFRVDTGVLVVDVAPGTPAAIAGIQPGDVIMNLDRVGVRSVDELRTGISRAGDTLPVTLVRQGSRIEVLLRRR